MYICMNTYIYLWVGGVGYKTLHLPKTPTQERRLLRGIRSWIKAAGDSFDSYDSSLSIRVIDSEGSILYSLSTGHAYSVPERVQDALWCVKSQAAEPVA